MNLIEGEVGGGRFRHAGFALPVPVPDGPATLAVRPEALGIAPAEGAAAAGIHRVTDFGTHAIVDIELADGCASSPWSPTPAPGRPAPPSTSPRAPSPLYRDNAAIHRSDG